jgi:tRNA(adenine34) deaminase
MTITTDHERFMRVAIEEAVKGAALGNMAVGGVIVRGGQILARGHNEAISAFDLTAHAETGPIRQLSVGQKIVNPSMRADSGPLAGSTLYTTCEPCPMCAWAICIAGISTVVIGARFADMGIGYGDYAIEKLLAMTGQPLKVVSRVLRDECEALRLRGQL